MKPMKQKACSRRPLAALVFITLALSLFELLFYRLTFGILDNAPDALKLADGFLHRAAEVFCIGGMCGTFLFRFYSGGFRSAAGAFPIATARLLYYLPYYYTTQFEIGYDSGDALILAGILSILRILLLGALLPALLAVIFRISLSLFRKAPPTAEDFSASDLLQLEKPLPLGALFASLPIFLYSLILEIIAAVGYLTEYVGSYRIGEIVYMAISFLFDLGLLFLHGFGILLACRILSKNNNHSESQVLS